MEAETWGRTSAPSHDLKHGSQNECPQSSETAEFRPKNCGSEGK